jgi:DNA-binding NarL/FixJ family response regulator
VTATRPRIVVVDDHRLFRSGVRAELGHSVEVVGEAADVESAVAVVQASRPDVVSKTISGPDLAAAIQRVADGDAVFSPRLAGFVLDAFAGAATPVGMTVDPELDALTPREREVLRLIARGYTYREIGRQLFISVKTVETHVSAVLRKLQLSNRHQLTRWASDRRLI